MPEVRIAARAEHFRARHEPAAVALFRHRLLGDRLPEAGPARARFELGVRGEERLPAADARIGPRVLGRGVLAAERALGAVLAGHVVLLRRELRLPLLVGLHDFFHDRSVTPAQAGAQFDSSRLSSADLSPKVRMPKAKLGWRDLADRRVALMV